MFITNKEGLVENIVLLRSEKSREGVENPAKRTIIKR